MPVQFEQRAPARLALSPAGALTCIVLVALTLRPGIVSTGPLLPSIIREFHVSHTQAALLTAIPTLLMGLLAAPTPWLARRFGRDRVMLGALGLLMLASLARAFTGSIAALFLATIAIGAGIALAGVLVAGFVKASFPARPALFMSVYATALALGSTVAAAATGAIVAAHAGWRLGAGIWALPALAALLAWLLLPFRRAAPAPAAAGPAQDGMPLRNRTAWLVALFFAANNFVFYACIAWLAPMYVEAGWAPARASLLLATFTIAFMAANPLFGYFSRSEDRRALLGLGAGIALAGVLALMIAPMAAPFLTVAVLAFGTGGAFTLSMTLPLDNTRTPEETSAWNAFVMLVSYSIAAVGPVAVGQLRDASGSFHGAHLMLAAVSALMLALTPFLQPHRPQAIGGLAPAM